METTGFSVVCAKENSFGHQTKHGYQVPPGSPRLCVGDVQKAAPEALREEEVAIDGPKHGSCYCHTTCNDLADCGEDDSMALNGFELPTSCGPWRSAF